MKRKEYEYKMVMNEGGMYLYAPKEVFDELSREGREVIFYTVVSGNYVIQVKREK